MSKELLRTALKDIARQFDYGKIQKYYQKKNWRWGGDIPTEQEIAAQVGKHINVIVDEGNKYVGSGGILIINTGWSLGIIFHALNSSKIKFGEFHDELSELISVSDYIDNGGDDE